MFDAIEFSPLIGSGDVLYDLAFLLMDLIERGLLQAADAVFNRYMAQTRRTEDLDALVALPFYLSLRAAIRAKVTAERRERAGPAAQAEIGESARSYFDLARRAIEPPAPVLVATGGRSGTGKSALAGSLAAQLAPMPGAVVLRSDAERKALFGKDESEKLPPEAYAAGVTAEVYALIADKARRALAAGHSAILDAVFGQPAERMVAEASAAMLGVPFHGLVSRGAAREPARARRGAQPRRLRCRCSGGARAGKLRSRRAHLDAHRRVRDAGGYAAGGADAAGLKRVQTRFGSRRFRLVRNS